MYERFFQLTSTPFSLVSNPDRIHFTAQHEDVIRGLAFGIRDRRGYTVLTAEAGLGKTTAVRGLSRLLIDSGVYVGTILTPTLTSAEFLELLMIKFGFKDIPASKALRLKLLEDFLIRSDAAGRLVALIVDEAHQLSEELLEEIRLLGNFETVDHKLLQIVLAGQMDLHDRLNLPQMWQFKQRIANRLSLERLNNEGVEEYIRCRWSDAGGANHFPFTYAALDAIAVWSCGIPRLINNICDHALLIAFSDTTRIVDEDIVRDACTELMLPTPGTDAQLKSADQSGSERAQSPNELKFALVKRWFHRSDGSSSGADRSSTSIFSLNEPPG